MTRPYFPARVIFLASVAVPLIMTIAACSAETDQPAAQADGVAATKDAAGSGGSAAKASLVEQKGEALEFVYSYPAAAAAIPKLAAHLDKDRESKRAQTNADALEAQADAKANGFPTHTHIFTQKWEEVAQTPRFLSLSSDVETYTGGAHGMVNFQAILWDRKEDVSVDPLDIFTSASAFDIAVEQEFCAGIGAEKKKRGIAPLDADNKIFEACPRASQQTLWLGSSDGKQIDRMTIAIPAYVVGPYAEGNYRINVPMTQAVAQVVKPEYAPDVRAQK